MNAPSPIAVSVRGSANMIGGAGAPLFEDITLNMPSGKWTCLLGASGVGKSTILRLIAGLEAHVAFSGTILADDDGPLDGRVAYMAQSDLLFPWATVLENVVTGDRLRGQAPDLDRARALIADVGLSEHINKRPDALSGGQRQRVALARTLMEDRPLILLDEPFSALDAKTRSEMQELAAHLLSDRTVLLVTHDPAEAARLGHNIYVMDGGGLTEAPAPETPPIRGLEDPASLACRAWLYRVLRGEAL
ncbi:MAG: ABC transporter ATP-binding protein [Pikeienuella sp.]